MMLTIGFLIWLFTFLSIHRLLNKKRSKVKSVGGSFILSLLLWPFLISIPVFLTSGFKGSSNAATATNNAEKDLSKPAETPPLIQSVWYEGAETDDSGSVYVCLNKDTSTGFNLPNYGVSFVINMKDGHQERSGEGYYSIQDIGYNKLYKNGKFINKCHWLISQSPYRKDFWKHKSPENLARINRLRKDNIASIDVELYKDRQLIDKKSFSQFGLIVP